MFFMMYAPQKNCMNIFTLVKVDGATPLPKGGDL